MPVEHESLLFNNSDLVIIDGKSVLMCLVNLFPLIPISCQPTIVLFTPSCLTLTPRPHHPPISSQFSIMPWRPTENAPGRISSPTHFSPTSRTATLPPTFSPSLINNFKDSIGPRGMTKD